MNASPAQPKKRFNNRDEDLKLCYERKKYKGGSVPVPYTDRFSSTSVHSHDIPTKFTFFAN